jgi:hypothetical protein
VALGRRKQSAAELLKRLASDKDYQERARALARERESIQAAALEEEKPILKDLGDAGLRASSISDLISSSDLSPAVISVLLRHLDREYSLRTLDVLVRALMSRSAVGVAWNGLESLLHKYKSRPEEAWYLIGTLCLALASIATDDDLPRLLGLLRDRSLGPNRKILLRNLSRLHLTQPEVRELANFASDPEIGKDVTKVLRKVLPR